MNSIPYQTLHKKTTKKRAIKSDHRTLILDLNIHFCKIKPDKREYFNFKSELCQEKFKCITDNDTKLIDCLNTELPLNEKAKVWQTTLEAIFHKSFTKIKVKNSKKKSNSKEAELLQERQTLLKKLVRNQREETSLRISDIEDQLAEINFQSAAGHMAEQFSNASENDSTGGTRTTWSIYRKMRPRHKPVVPVGKMDKQGNIVTNHTEHKKLYIDTFIWRLRKRSSNPKLLEIHRAKENFF